MFEEKNKGRFQIMQDDNDNIIIIIMWNLSF